ncbi:MAG TPA: hypothetical protein ENI64_12980, partial [Gammaproteobacteria bacterium]|nr:hypothetical protein [Gammaproteobacteria bacterium]
DLFASLEQEPFKIKGLDIYPIKPTTERISTAASKQAKLQAGWIMYPIADGSYEIKLPDIQYELNGVIRYSIPIPAFSVSVQALPAYVPPTLPVGKLTIEQRYADRLINTNTLGYWKLTLKGDGIPAQWLPAVLRQIKSNDDIRYSPVTSERSNTAGVNGMQSQVLHTVPLKALSNGTLDLPALRVQYFDPADGRLKTLAIEKQNNIYALSYFWRIIVLLILGGLLYKSLKWLKEFGHKKWLKRKLLMQAMHQIGQARTVCEIRPALNLIALAENWPDNLSISAWYCLWNSKYRAQEDLDSLVANLSLACYSNRDMKIDPEYRNHFLLCITKAMITRRS